MGKESGRSQIIRRRESPVLYQSLNILKVLQAQQLQPIYVQMFTDDLFVFIYRRPTLYPLEIAVDFLKSL